MQREHLGCHGVADASELEPADAERYVHAVRALAAEHTGHPFPDDPHEQLLAAIEAVFRSWSGRRARDYRRLEGIADHLGTAVNVQAMVFGNLGRDSGTGVVFTRNPATGAREPYGDFLLGAQGEDVVAGVRTTEPFAALADHFLDVHTELLGILQQLERRYRDMCDVEFTVERGKLWVLQTRIGKRSAPAALRMAVEMVDERLIDPDEAVRGFRPEQLERLLHAAFDASVPRQVLATGLAASPGAASGEVCFTADDAEARATQ